MGQTGSKVKRVQEEYRKNLFEERLPKIDSDIDVEGFNTIKDLEDDLNAAELSEKDRLQQLRNTLPERKRRKLAQKISEIEEEISQWFSRKKQQKRLKFDILMRRDKRRKRNQQLEEELKLKRDRLNMEYQRQLKRDELAFEKQQMDHVEVMTNLKLKLDQQKFEQVKEATAMKFQYDERMEKLALESTKEQNQFAIKSAEDQRESDKPGIIRGLCNSVIGLF